MNTEKNTQATHINYYAVRDVKTNFFDIPFAAHNDQMAQRKFTMDINQEGTLLNQFPEDFELWSVSRWAYETGDFESTYYTKTGDVAVSNKYLIISGKDIALKTRMQKDTN